MKGTYAWFRSKTEWQLVGSVDVGFSTRKAQRVGNITWSPRQNCYVWNQSRFIKDFPLDSIREIEDKLAELNEKETEDSDLAEGILASAIGSALGSTLANIVNKRKKEDKEEDEE